MPAIFLEDRPPRASCGDSKFSTHTSSVTRASICSKRNAREVTEVTVKNKIYMVLRHFRGLNIDKMILNILIFNTMAL
jgi:hypothetical protein